MAYAKYPRQWPHIIRETKVIPLKHLQHVEIKKAGHITWSRIDALAFPQHLSTGANSHKPPPGPSIKAWSSVRLTLLYTSLALKRLVRPVPFAVAGARRLAHACLFKTKNKDCSWSHASRSTSIRPIGLAPSQYMHIW